MKKSVPVAKVMSVDPVSVSRSDAISKVRQLFGELGVHHLPVTSGDKLIGIISWTDLMRISFGDVFDQDPKAEDAVLDHLHRIDDIMETEPVTIRPDAPIREAAEILAGSTFHALPVVDEGRLVGIVSTQDLIRHLLELY